MKRNFTLLAIILFSNLGVSQIILTKQWDYRYGGIGMDGLRGFLKTKDQGFICAGTCYSMQSGDITHQNRDASNLTSDYWIIKIDSNGTKQWDNRYGGDSWEYFRSLHVTSDGGFILGGYTQSYISGDISETSRGGFDYWIIKLDSLGNKMWDKRFGGSGDDELWCVKQLHDGGYLLAGESNSINDGDRSEPSWGYQDYWAVRTDSSGNKIWDKRFGGHGSDILYDFFEDANQNLLLIGDASVGIGGDFSTVGYGNGDYWLVKIDPAGNKIWDKPYGGISADEGMFIDSLYGGYILGGKSWSGASGNKSDPSNGARDYWVIKIDTAGNIEWNNSLGGQGDETDFGNVIATADSGLLITGYSRSVIASGEKSENNLGTFNPWIVKTNEYGTIDWEKTIQIPGDNQFNQGGIIIQTSDDCFVLASCVNAGIGGYKSQPNWDPTDSTYDMWVVKFCGDSLFNSSKNIIYAYDDWCKLYPNPTSNSVYLKTTSSKFPIELKIYNSYGVLLRREFIFENNSEYKIELSDYTSGLYFIQVSDGERQFTGKLNVNK